MSSTSKVCVEFQTGNINAEEGSGKAYVFHSPCAGSLRFGEKETYISNAISLCSELGVKGATFSHTARKNIQKEIGGKVFQTTWNLEDGEIFKIFAQGKAGGWNSRLRTAVMYIKLRASGPMNKVHILVPQGVIDSTFSSWTAVGRFDILTMEEVEALGVNVLESMRAQGNESVVEALFRVEQLEEEFSAPTKVILKRVGKRVMPVTVRKRSLDL